MASITYITPTGSGDKSGSSWANAASIGSLDAMVKKAGVGGTVLLAADKGDYVVKSPITINGAGVTVTGINTDGSAGEAHFTGTRPSDWSKGDGIGNDLFRINKGADGLTFQNMQIDDTGTAFKVIGDVKNLTVQHVDADNVQRFFENYASSSNTTATINGLTIRDVEVAGFSENVVRLQYDTSNVLIEDVRGDSQRQDDDGFTMGVHLTDTVHDVVMRRVTMENATGDRGTGVYWNADGFAAERGTYNLTFEDTVARGNTDGGYDIKASHVTFIRAIAEDNARNFRLWGDDVKLIDSVGLNPQIRGGSGSQAQLWVDKTGSVTVTGGMFSDAGTKTKVFENEGSLKVSGVKIVQATEARTVVGNKPAGLVDASVTKVTAVGITSQGATYHDGTAVTSFVRSDAVEVVVTAPTAVTTPPVSTTPVVSAPAPVAPTTPVQTELRGDWVKVATTGAGETIAATARAEKFVFDNTRASGKDVITGFGANDVVVLSQKLGDADGDGVTGFGSDGILDFSKGNTLKIEGVKSLRLIGENADGFVYGDAAVWKAGSALPKATGEARFASTASNETFIATNARETFFFDVKAGKTGIDTIKGFGQDDAIVTKVALMDGNKDGLIQPGKSGLDLGGGNLVKELALGKSGLRAMGETAEGFVYADAAVRPKGAQEGKLTVSDTLSGGKADTARDSFFFDTALHRALGDDKVVNFGAKDVIVTTSQIGTGAAGSLVKAVGGHFALTDEGAAMGSVAVTGIGGAAVTALEYDGVKTVGGVDYFVYSLVGSAVGLDAVG